MESVSSQPDWLCLAMSNPLFKHTKMTYDTYESGDSNYAVGSYNYWYNTLTIEYDVNATQFAEIEVEGYSSDEDSSDEEEEEYEEEEE